jgi:hypothetical protein
MKMRYALVNTWSHRPDTYYLACRNIASSHFDFTTDAVAAALAIAPSMFEKIKPDTISVVRVECFDHGECRGTVFYPDEVTTVLTLRKEDYVPRALTAAQEHNAGVSQPFTIVVG